MLRASVPRAFANENDFRPGDDLKWQTDGDLLRVVPPEKRARPFSIAERLHLFDQTARRQYTRDLRRQFTKVTERGWSRDELYERGDGTA